MFHYYAFGFYTWPRLLFNLEAGHAAMFSVMEEEATLVTLVKPQTEARRSQVRVLHQPLTSTHTYLWKLFRFILLEIRKYSRDDNIERSYLPYPGYNSMPMQLLFDIYKKKPFEQGIQEKYCAFISGRFQNNEYFLCMYMHHSV